MTNRTHTRPARRPAVVLRGAAWAIALLVAAAGCHWGTRQARYASQMDASGSDVTVRWSGPRMRGELLVADSAGVIVRSDRFVRIEWPRLQEVNVLAPSRLRLSGSAAEARWRELALYSRFPHGLRPELLARLLAAAGQDSLEVAR